MKKLSLIAGVSGRVVALQADFGMQALGWHAQEGSRTAVPPVPQARERPRAPTSS